MNPPIVRLMHYDPRWRQEFQQTRSSVLQSCLGWVTQVEHIGSTAINGLIARPTIDVLAGIDCSMTDSQTQAFSESSKQIEGLNFRVESADDWPQQATVLAKPRHGEATHRVFLMQIGCPAWNQAIAIRNRLLQDRELALRFEETKVARWRNGEGDPEKYAADKAVFFTHVLDQIDGQS